MPATASAAAAATRPTLDELIRPHLKGMRFYKSARGEFSGRADVLLDANENPYDGTGQGLNRYPDPAHRELRAAVAEAYDVPAESVFVGMGSSEALDLLMRLVGRPGRDRIVQLPPTFGIYAVDAGLNELDVLSVPLVGEGLQPDVDAVLAQAEPGRDRILFLCTPNNPTGHDYERERVMRLVEGFPGLVVLDQAYVEFSGLPPYRQLFREYPHVLTVETMSKAYGLAGSRVGLAFGDPALIAWLNRVKPPYNVGAEAEANALAAVRERDGRVREEVTRVLAERKRLVAAFAKTGFWRRVYPTDANFVLVAHDDADAVYRYLITRGIIVRNQTARFGEGHLRVSVGTPAENDRLLAALAEYTD